MTSHQLRQKFLQFFEQHQHKTLPSSSLVPDNDPTVLLTTAGMQQFKLYFLGEKDPQEVFGASRIATIQKSFRTSDIDSVGDESHLTFFEMLGDFSFGDYWKTEAIHLAWTFLTEELKLDPDYLWVTIFAGDDQIPRDVEAENEWKKYVSAERIVAKGREDNFWGPPGKSGPCGPCTEIHYQLNSAAKVFNDRDFLEIWNLVFTEYFSDEKHNLTQLPKKNIDTGMGLERLLYVVEKKSSFFDTDAFAPIMDEVEKIEGFGKTEDSFYDDRRKRIVADHIRGAVFLMCDGVNFSNKDQGYILRRIIRRAADQFMTAHFSFGPLVEKVVNHFHEQYPELKTKQADIMRLLEGELEQYRKILEMNVTDMLKKIHKTVEATESAGMSTITIEPAEAFTLYATHGLSLDRLERVGLRFDRQAVQKQIAEHQELSRAGAGKKFGGHGLNDASSDYTDEQRQVATRLHTATHLLHAALRQVLGDSVRQSGSDITPERLRFDFSFDRKLTDEEKKKVEDLVNEKVQEDLPVTAKAMPFQQAIDEGALAFFKEKYPDQVNVYSIGDFSKELCGGPHVEHTAVVGKFKITGESSVGSGLRRIKAVVQ